MDLSEIEDKVCNNEMTPSQVFTQMKQHIERRNEIIDEVVCTIRDCELVEPNVFHIRVDEAVGAVLSLKRA